MPFLVLVRHGQSRWNLANMFTGWVDVPLSEKGIYEALQSAKELEGIKLDVAFTSDLVRAQETLFLILASQSCTGVVLHPTDEEHARWYEHAGLSSDEILVHTSKALNERYYGELQGINKQEAREKWGDEQVHLWRRSYDIPPPGGESLKDVYARTVPFFVERILPLVQQGKNVIVSAHGNSLRAIMKHIDNISDEQIPNLELPTGKPIVYRIEGDRLVADNHEHSFERPVFWEEPESHKLHNT